MKSKKVSIFIAVIAIVAFTAIAFIWLTKKPEQVVLSATLSDVKLSDFTYGSGEESWKLGQAHAAARRLYPDVLSDINDNLPVGNASSKSLEIVEKSGKYYWKSNQGQQLLMYEHLVHGIERDGKEGAPEIFKMTIFRSIKNDGVILVIHMPPKPIPSGCHMHLLAKCKESGGCMRYGSNLIEYRIAPEKGLSARIGRTVSFPYPTPDVCVKGLNTE